MFPQSEIENVLRVLGAKGVKRSGDQLICTCPFAPWTHKDGKDKNPSFSIALSGEHKWKCFGGNCQHYGTNLYWLIDRYEEISGQDLSSVKEQCDKYEKVIRDKEFRPRLFRFRPAIKWPTKIQAEEKTKPREFRLEDYRHMYLESGMPGYAWERGLSLELWQRWQLGFDSARSRLFIPIFERSGKLVGFSSRRILDDGSPKYWNSPGFNKDVFLYGEHLIDPSSDIAFMSEGYFDVWALDRAGLKNPLAFMGTGVGEQQLLKIIKWFKTVVLFPHNDEPDKNGQKAGDVIVEKWIEALRSCGTVVYVVRLPGMIKDVGDMSPGQIKAVLKGAKKQ
jgi:hypothetical protein